MPKRQSSSPRAFPIHHSRKTRQSLYELFLNNAGEVVKLYSSVHRVRNYYKPLPPQEAQETRYGKDRLVRQFSNLGNENPFTPKISHRAYEALKSDGKLWLAYQNEVLNKDIVGKGTKLFDGVNRDYSATAKLIQSTYLRVLHNLESSWLYQRAYYKLFDDYHQKPKTFLELEAFVLTHSNQFFMRHFLNYLEGNYVISVRGTGKVYVPHLQAELDSVDLPYTSAHGIGYGSVISDYFEKAMIASTKQLVENFRNMRHFSADVAEGHKDEIFLHCSQYINSERFQVMCEEWLTKIGNTLFAANIKEREARAKAIEALIRTGDLDFPQDLFNKTKPEIEQFIENYEDDWHLFGEVDKASAIKRILRRIFVSLIEHAINRHRMESRGGPESEIERTEYETVFRKYRDMTLLEQRLNCLLVEDGEISLVLLLASYLKQPQKLDTTAYLLRWGLIEEVLGKTGMFKYSSRAQRMAKWCAKVAGWDLQYRNGNFANELDYTKNGALRSHYDPLSLEPDALFHWMRLVKNKTKLQKLLAEMALAKARPYTTKEVTEKFRTLVELCLLGKEEDHRDRVENSVVKGSRFNQDLNEFLRTNETISRAVVAIPISTIPTDLTGFRDKIYGFSIFIGTFQFSEGLDNDKRFEHERQEIAEILRAAKVYFTLIGKPAGEVLNQFVVHDVSAKRVASNLGKFAHSLKNEGVSFRAQIDTLKETVKKASAYDAVKVKVDELEMSLKNEDISFRAQIDTLKEIVETVSANDAVKAKVDELEMSLRNKDVSFRAQIDTLKETVKKVSANDAVKAKVDELEKSFERFNGAIQLLNLTSNPFQGKYLASRPYCLLDVILQAYCNALDQFLVAGPIRELKNMRLSDGKYFKSPILRVTVENQFDHRNDFASKHLQYFPDLPNVSFHHATTTKFDAEAVLTAEQIFRDTLPDWNMMVSAYLEIFNNVLQYCRKDADELFFDIKLKRNPKEIFVEIANEATAENLQRLSAFSMEDSEPARGRGAGVDTNTLFFKKIGGDFRLISDFDNIRALTISRINLEFLERFI